MTRADDVYKLPADLPVPVDDGACDHLPGLRLPAVALPSTAGRMVDLAGVRGRSVVYIYPATGKPGVPSPAGWDDIPGARGCTPQSCGFRDHFGELTALGVAVYGLSTQSPVDQQEAAVRLGLPYVLLSDAGLSFARSLRLPTFTLEGGTYIKRITLVIRDGRTEHVFYPVFPPDRNAADVVAWLRTHRQ